LTMEVHSATYRTFAEVHIEHDYYRAGSRDYDIRRDLECMPSAACRQTLRDQRILLRHTTTGFRLLVEARPAGTTPISFSPLIPVEEPLKLTFFLCLRNPYFVNFTNLDLTDAPAHLYYFSNLAANISGGTRYLNRALPAYASGSSYHFGDLVLQGGSVHQANTAIPSAPAIFVPASWDDLGNAIPYVNSSDRIRKQGLFFRYERPNLNPGERIDFALADPFGAPFTPAAVPGTGRPASPIQAPDDPAEAVRHQLSLERLPVGRYTLSVSHQFSADPPPVEFYLYDPARYANVLGVIELYVHPGVPAGYQLLRTEMVGGVGIPVLESPVFHLHFRNRATIWRYLEQDDNERVSSVGPRPLTFSPSGFQDPRPGINDLLPDPGVQKLLVHRNADGLVDSVVSEIYL
jgi:hypothetical protein